MQCTKTHDGLSGPGRPLSPLADLSVALHVCKSESRSSTSFGGLVSSTACMQAGKPTSLPSGRHVSGTPYVKIGKPTSLSSCHLWLDSFSPHLHIHWSLSMYTIHSNVMRIQDTPQIQGLPFLSYLKSTTCGAKQRHLTRVCMWCFCQRQIKLLGRSMYYSYPTKSSQPHFPIPLNPTPLPYTYRNRQRMCSKEALNPKKVCPIKQ